MTIDASNIDTQSSRHYDGLMPAIKKPTVSKFLGSQSPAPKMMRSIQPSPKMATYSKRNLDYSESKNALNNDIQGII
jgi:hypothetical protein